MPIKIVTSLVLALLAVVIVTAFADKMLPSTMAIILIVIFAFFAGRIFCILQEEWSKKRKKHQ